MRKSCILYGLLALLKLLLRTLLLLLFIISSNAIAQDQIGINPPSLKWSRLSTPAGEIIYPRGLDSLALSVAYRINGPFLYDNHEILKGKKPMAIPTIIQNQSVFPEGFATTAPWRQELYIMPPQNMFLGPSIWMDAVTSHEYRHAQQFMAYNQHLTTLYKVLMGDTGWLLGTVLNVPLWFREGDAVDIETRYTTGGRGQLPGFHMEYRTLLLNDVHYSYEKAISASNFKDFVPNAYRTGYYMSRHLRQNKNDSIWAGIMKTSSKNLIYPFSNAMRSMVGQQTPEFYKSTMDSLEAFWLNGDTLTYEEGKKITKASGVYEKYRMPQKNAGGKLIVAHESFEEIRTFYEVENNGTRQKVLIPGIYNADHENFTVEGNIMTWAESAFHPRYRNLTYSVIKSMDLTTKEVFKHSSKSRYFSPAPSKDGKKIAVIAYDNQANCSLTIINRSNNEILNSFDYHNQFLSQPRWINNEEIVMITVNKEGNQLIHFNMSNNTWNILLDARDVNISNPFPYQDHIYFSSGLTTIENIYRLNMMTSQVEQITESRFGAFDPFVADDILYFSNYELSGYQIHSLSLKKSLTRPAFFPNKTHFNSKSSYNSFEAKAAIRNDIKTETHYRHFFWNKLFHATGWFPLFFPPEYGVELYSLNLERTFKSTLGLNFNTNENILQGKINASYARFFPIFNVNASVQSREFKFSGTSFEPDTISSIVAKESIIGSNVEIPLQLTQGLYRTQLNLNAGFSYRKVANINNDFQGFDFNNMEFGMMFSRIRPIARRQVKPKFGQFLRVGYKADFANDGGKQLFINSLLYFPGFINNHSLNFRGSLENNQNPQNYRFLSTFRTSRGYQYYPFDKVTLFSTNYELPLAYPDFYLRGFLGVSRIRLNAFFDHGKGSTPLFDQHQRSAGVEFIFDLRLFRAFNMDLQFQFIRLFDHHNSQRPFVFTLNVGYFEFLN